MRDTVMTAVFPAIYYAVTIWLCRGVRLKTKELCLCGLSIALTMVLERQAQNGCFCLQIILLGADALFRQREEGVGLFWQADAGGDDKKSRKILVNWLGICYNLAVLC